jgi:hypothetical protein
MEVRSDQGGLAGGGTSSRRGVFVLSQEHIKMWSTQRGLRWVAAAIACAVMVSLGAGSASATQIDVSLNLRYTDRMDPASGGNWEILAKSDGGGIASLSLRLKGIAPGVTNEAPRGIVNGDDPAGFGVFYNFPDTGHRQIIIGQKPLLTVPPGDEQTVFYGVGVVPNGTPDYPGKDPAATPVGPPFISLTAVQDVPWATDEDPIVEGDSPWDFTARMASGTFAPGSTPSFFTGGGETSTGSIFTAVGVIDILGVSPLTSAVVRTDLLVTTLVDADYNDDGFVNSPDYVVWRNQLGMTQPGLEADGAGPAGPGIPDGTVDRLDFDYWKANFGVPIPGSGSAVPEPAGGLLLLIGSVLAAWRVRGPKKALWMRSEGPGMRSTCQAAGSETLDVLAEFSPWNEKSDFKGGNCLTAWKRGNIMPQGSAVPVGSYRLR